MTEHHDGIPGSGKLWASNNGTGHVHAIERVNARQNQ
jgi:hypothetical protein